MRNRPARAELFHSDGQTGGQRDMTLSIVSFPSFANAPRNDDNGSEDIEIREMC
jgi:hypothetical protein